MSVEALTDRLAKVEAALQEVLGGLSALSQRIRDKESRRDYNANYYAARQAEKRQHLLKNPDRNNLNLTMGYDRRLRSKFEEWAAVGYRFAECGGDAYKFLEWLAFTWNACTYWHRPITKSGGYNHLFIGFSGNRPLRAKWTDNDLFGCVKRTRFTRPQRDQFGKAPWWKWGYGVLGKCVFEMQDDEARWARLPGGFTRPLLLLMGGWGEVALRAGLKFDPSEEDCAAVGKMYQYAKPDLDRGWRACKKGLFGKEPPALPDVNGSTA